MSNIKAITGQIELADGTSISFTITPDGASQWGAAQRELRGLHFGVLSELMDAAREYVGEIPEDDEELEDDEPDPILAFDRKILNEGR